MSISAFLGPLQNLLSSFQSERHYKDARKDEALSAIYDALIETKKYVELSGGTQDREKEYQLAQMWAAASVKARHVSRELGIVMKGKSEYWSDTIEWSREEVVDKGIDFDALEDVISALLGDR